jgi:hypothetical protein
VFAEHKEHDVAVPPLEKEPGEHVAQLEPDKNRPALQDTCEQNDERAPDTVPGGQVRQLEARDPE